MGARARARNREFTYYGLIILRPCVFSTSICLGENPETLGKRIFTRHVRIFDRTFYLPLSLSFSLLGLYSEFFLAVENLYTSWPFLVNFTACRSKTPSPRATSYFVKPVTREKIMTAGYPRIVSNVSNRSNILSPFHAIYFIREEEI